MNDHCLDWRWPFKRGIWKTERREEIWDPESSRLCQPDGIDWGVEGAHEAPPAGWGSPHDRTIFFPGEYPTLTIRDWLPVLYASVPSSKLGLSFATKSHWVFVNQRGRYVSRERGGFSNPKPDRFQSSRSPNIPPVRRRHWNRSMDEKKEDENFAKRSKRWRDEKSPNLNAHGCPWTLYLPSYELTLISVGSVHKLKSARHPASDRRSQPHAYPRRLIWSWHLAVFVGT